MAATKETKEPVVLTGFEDSTPLLGDPTALRRRADEEGVLFFRGLLPREHVLEVRRQLLEVLNAYGWIRRDHDLMDGYVNAEAVRDLDAWGGTGVTEAAYLDTQKVEIFHRLAHHPDLIRMYETLFGEAVLPHPRNIARLMVPNPASRPTPIHQDFIHIQGTRNVWTCWAPLGDIPLALGGLAVMPRSHKLGVLSVTGAEGAGGLETILCDVDLPWIQENYRAGDVLTFNSCTVHKSLPNETPERVRLSVDYRYQPADEDVEEKSLRPHMDVATWDEIYADWPSDELKYYWTKHDLQLSPWDELLRWQKEKIC